MNKLTLSSICGIAAFLLLPLQEMNAQQKEYGKIDFDVSCQEAVQDDFDRALGMLHNMMYATAREAFEKIIKVDPNCAMGYWGVATTLFQPLWPTRPSPEDLQRGWHTIENARDLVESGREELLIESTAEFFREPETVDYSTRIQRWIDAMEHAYEAYSGDVDVAVLYGLSRLALAPRVVDAAPLLDEAEAIFRGIFEQVPTHPGAIHYSIHATDVDGRAENALDIVEAYSKIAPEVPHALHMPTHIYVRLGDWPEIINWNLKSAEAALNHPVNGATSHHFMHAIDYLVYAYLQRGEDEKADAIVEKAWKKDKHQKSFISAFHFAAVPARLAVERHDWEQAVKLQPRTPGYLPWDAAPWAEGLTWYARGLGAIHTGDIEAAQEAEKRLAELRDKAKEAGETSMVTYIEIDRHVIEGWIKHKEGNNEKAAELIRSAAELEKTIEKHPVTPGAILPPYEALGDLLLELGRPVEALKAYESSDAIWPGRYNTLIGAARAARAAGEVVVAQKYYDRLLANTGDSDRTGIHEAKGFIAEQ